MKRLGVFFITVATSVGISFAAFSLMGGKSEVLADLDYRPAKAPIHLANYGQGQVMEQEVNFVEAAEKTLDAVVHIKTLSKSQVRQGNPFHDFFFGHPGYSQQPRYRAGSGSGVIISQDGYVLTNNHVIEGAEEIEVTLNDKRSAKAKLVGADPQTDLAVLQVEVANLSPAYFGNSDQVKVGQWVLAIGNPFNLASTVTAGIVSAKGRNIDIIQENYKIESFIQTDAAVNPGNSGGALVNTQGELVGINTAIASTTGAYAGYAFAIPSNLAKKIAADLIEFGTVQRAMLGVNIRDIDQEFATKKSLKSLKGVWIDGLMEGSAAQDAGLKPGDIIKQIDGHEVESVAALQERVGLYRPGDKIEVLLLRDGKQWKERVTLRNRLGDTRLLNNYEALKTMLGASLVAPGPELSKRLNLSGGLEVEALEDGLLSRMGIRKGYIITEINGVPIASHADVDQALRKSPGRLYVGGFYPSGEKVFYSIN